MELFLWRHAEALDGTPDFERELSRRGHEQARKAAEWFREHVEPGVLADLRLLVSPAVRTRQTVAHFCGDENRIQLCPPLYNDASSKEILDMLGWPNITLPALIVGHQPQIGLFADHLLGETPHPLSFRKSALWWLRLEPGQGSAQLVNVVEV